MKLNVKSFGIVCGLWWDIAIAWAFIVKFTGVGSVPYDFINQFYLGWLAPSAGGMVIGLAIGFVDGLIAGLIFAWLYNRLSRNSE